jgi:hypothetical protein
VGFFQDITGQSGARAAREAADLQYLNQSKAAGGLADSGRKYESAMRENAQAFNPWIDAGKSSLEMLMRGLMGGQGAQQFTDAYRSLPGYQAGIDTGITALDRSAAARGMTKSGAQMKALSKFGSDYEDQRSGQYMNRLATMGTQGLSAQGSQVGTIGTGLQGQLGADTGAADMMYRAAGTVPQGIIGAQNASNAGSQNMLNMGMQGLSMLTGGLGGGGSSFLGQSTMGGKSGGWTDPDSGLGSLRRLFG